MAPRVRFAPSPTGYLHLGSARSALFNWLYARHTDGTLVLRIEDTDRERSSQEMIDLILRTFDWLGIDFDEGPLHQSERGELYRTAAERLFAEGHAYYCDQTPEQIQERTGGAGYDGYSRDRGLGPGPGRVLRFRVPDSGSTVVRDVIRGDVVFDHADLEDFVIVRSDGTPVFLLANAVDDADMAITHVIRGEDLLNTTPKVLLLWEALGIRPGAVSPFGLINDRENHVHVFLDVGTCPRPWSTTSPCSGGGLGTTSRCDRSARSSSSSS